jgi:hypothetical protein
LHYNQGFGPLRISSYSHWGVSPGRHATREIGRNCRILVCNF